MFTGHVQLSRETPKHLPSRAPEKKKKKKNVTTITLFLLLFAQLGK